MKYDAIARYETVIDIIPEILINFVNSEHYNTIKARSNLDPLTTLAH